MNKASEADLLYMIHR